VWVRPADALARHEAGEFFMIPPTIRTLERLQHYPSVDAVLHACAAYDDVPPRMWPVAKRSLMAHVARIEALAT
jgi:hypothetical protein